MRVAAGRGADGEPSEGLRGEVTVFENLLEYGLASVAIAGRENFVVAQTQPEEVFASGDSVVLTADPERVYTFDADSGVRLR